MTGAIFIAGLGLAAGLLAWRGWLTIDAETWMPRVQRPPLYLYEPGHEVTGHRYVYDATLGWRNIPNMKGTSNGRALTINSRGLRDEERRFDKPSGSKRILVLGDSYAWGYGVGDDEVFSRVLQHRFEESNLSWEVINTGVSGWGTDQEYLYFINEGYRYQPDIVVLAFFIVNDPKNNASSMQYGLYKPIFQTPELKVANVPVPKPDSEAPVLRSQVHPLTLTLAIIDALAAASARHGSPLVVMKFGNFLAPDHAGLQNAADVFAGEVRRIPNTHYLDIDAELTKRSISVDSLLEGNDDGHWNAVGHRVVAEILHEFLVTNALVPAS